MLPRPGCDEILPARSSVSEEEPTTDEVPGTARVEGEDVRASMGRRGLRRERARDCEGVDRLGMC
jgi:hypothetical protein